MSSLLPLIGQTPSPIVEVIQLTIGGSGYYGGSGAYPQGTIAGTITAIIEDLGDTSQLPNNTTIVALLNELNEGSKTKHLCSETIIAGQVVSLVNPTLEYRLASADNVNDIARAVGIALQSANVGVEIYAANAGTITSPSFNFNYPAPVYLGINGTVTQNTLGLLFKQQVGIAVSPTKFNILIGIPIKRFNS